MAGALLLGACGPFGPAPGPPPAPAPPPPTSASGGVIAGSRVGLAEAYNPLWESDAQLAADFDAIRATGATWVRFDFDWSAVQGNGPNAWNWAVLDRGVAAARARGLKVLATLAYTPAWARPGGTTDKNPPTNPDDFAAYARAAAQRYGAQGVQAYEIWNEPNNPAFWQPSPDPAAYTVLLRRADAAIKAVDPGATVMTGGTSPMDGADAPAAWLQAIYADGGGGAFDAVAHHPYTGMPYGPSTVASWNAFQQTVDVHNVMVNNGDAGKLVWGTEAGAWTGTSANAVSEATQAQFVTEYLQGWSNWASFTGPFFYYGLRDQGTDLTNREDNFGLLHNDGSPKPAMATFTSDIHP
ncbi:MAG TPA: cellulase family glycosylhydrolase [Acidimicrobiia bacterium]|nr:cellulase family glycosylhydrolase [Acidimicrobiia bacterium]